MAGVKGSSIDCHIHIVGDHSKFPMAEHRSYTTPPASFYEYCETMNKTDVGRAVLVQPSCYASDNSCLVNSLDALGDRARGVAGADPARVDDRQLSDLHDHGVRGVRVNLLSVRDRARRMQDILPATDQAIAGSGWHIQVFCAADALSDLAALQDQIRATVVIDHFGFVRPENRKRDLPNLLQLLKNGAWVKLSGADRIADGPGSPGIAELAREIFATAPDRVIWGSDWPHTPMHSGERLRVHKITPYRKMNTPDFFFEASAWFADEGDRHKLFVRNPTRLYDWPAEEG